MQKKYKPELLAPAGDMEKLKYAVAYGADAVYLAGKEFGMRTASGNFDDAALKTAVDFAHEKGVKVYVTLNTVVKSEEAERLTDFIKYIDRIKTDAVIVTDLGVFGMVKKLAPNLDIHISTQANTVSYQSASMWHSMGAKRVVLARELNLTEIKIIRDNTPQELEIECFVHGAMCVSHSGRCLLSNYLSGRDANKGNCAQSCRWKYTLMEETRAGQYMPVVENDRGAFIFNSKDMNMIEHISKLATAGIDSFKLEGRVKSAYYAAVVTGAYRHAIDDYINGESEVNPIYAEELEKISHREYYTGFFFGDQKENAQIYTSSSYIRTYEIVAVVNGYDAASGMCVCELKNQFGINDEIELLTPSGEVFAIKVNVLTNAKNEILERAIHPQMIFKMKTDKEYPPYSIIRKIK